MIYAKGQRVLVQGITGTQGRFWAEKMAAMGTVIAGGVNPKRAGESLLGVPVFASAKAAMDEAPFDIAVMFIPPNAAKAAALDAIEAGAQGLVILTEHIPQHDVLIIRDAARAHGTRIVGPNTAGLVTPGTGFVGIMPGHNPTIFQPGRIGVISRSGSLGTLVCLNLTRAGLGQSAFIGVGGDPMVGTTTRDALQLMDQHPGTDAIVLVGEIGGAMEEDAARYATGMAKPVVAFIAGRIAPPGKTMGHAGALATPTSGSFHGKRVSLEAAGIQLADTPSELPALIASRL